MKYLRWLLFPFSLLYGLVVIVRNFCYDAGIFKSAKFDKPIIAVGNLDVGGAGKSPVTEYLIRLLKDNYKLATLSRGYGRKTKGFIIKKGGPTEPAAAWRNLAHTVPVAPALTSMGQPAAPRSIAAQIGDEPAQFKHKFPEITVAVCESRAGGISQLLAAHDIIIMDDAYQHRAVVPGLSILLFDYNRLNGPHLLLPAGNLREPFSGRWRAQIIIISKCPAMLTLQQKETAYQKIAPLPYQQLFFASIAYQQPIYMDGKPADMVIDGGTSVFLLTGIANAKPLVDYLSGFTSKIIHHNYPDHHQFTLKNIAKLAAGFNACQTEKKLIITTEKDAQRLESSWFSSSLPGFVNIPVFVIPIKVEFLNNSGQQFDQLITEYVRAHTAYNSIH